MFMWPLWPGGVTASVMGAPAASDRRPAEPPGRRGAGAVACGSAERGACGGNDEQRRPECAARSTEHRRRVGRPGGRAPHARRRAVLVTGVLRTRVGAPVDQGLAVAGTGRRDGRARRLSGRGGRAGIDHHGPPGRRIDPGLLQRLPAPRIASAVRPDRSEHGVLVSRITAGPTTSTARLVVAQDPEDFPRDPCEHLRLVELRL